MGCVRENRVVLLCTFRFVVDHDFCHVRPVGADVPNPGACDAVVVVAGGTLCRDATELTEGAATELLLLLEEAPCAAALRASEREKERVKEIGR